MGTHVGTVFVVGVINVAAVVCACSNSPTAPTMSNSPTASIASLAVTGAVPAVGQTSQLRAKATLSNGTAQDVTTQAMWVSSNTTIATVTSDGLLKVLQPGSCSQITATYQGISGTLEVNLGAPSGQGCWDY
jgi:hypothetical protein